MFLGWYDTTLSCYIYCLKIQLILRVQDTVFEHNCDYPFLNPDCVITPGTLTGEQIVQMHLADEKEGMWMEDHDDTKSQAATQLADGGALRVREELTSLQDIVTQLQEPLKA
eukprot:3379151-Rhodomonas_salina.1